MSYLRLLTFHQISKGLIRRTICQSVIDIKPEIKKCLKEKTPIVALETTIVTHGMPYPVNYDTTRQCQEIIRSEGCTPALIALIKGRVKVGLDDDELEYLARCKDRCIKTSRRDFPFVLSQKLNGGTTVSATVLVASQVGIKIFATGGLGGVHRLGEDTMDISADLTELGRNQIMVVSSGVKSILDIGRTLEYLETQGVLVCSYKNDNVMPAFFSKKSNFKTPYSISSPEHGASLLKSLIEMDLKSGVLIAVPIPDEHSIDYDTMETVINDALQEADSSGIRGKQVTPFLLEKINKLTEGKSLESNIALIKNNCKVAAQIAKSYSCLINDEIKDLKVTGSYNSMCLNKDSSSVVIGGSVVDITVSTKDNCTFDGRTVNADIEYHCGGVGRNLADALGKLNCKTKFISVVGDDPNGDIILNSLNHLDKSSVEIIKNESTACYTVLLDQTGNCLLCAGNSDIHYKTDIQQICRNVDQLHNSNFIIIDSNINEETIEYVLNFSLKHALPVWIEPTSLLKCHKVLTCESVNAVSYISPNLYELRQMSLFLGCEFNEDFKEEIDAVIKQVIYLGKYLVEKTKSNLMITMGHHGTMIINKNDNYCRYYPVKVNKAVINASGAGDCGAAGFISGYLRGLTEQQCVQLAHIASEASLMSKSPVPNSFTYVDNVEHAQYSEVQL